MRRKGWHYVGMDMQARSFKLGPLRIVQIEDKEPQAPQFSASSVIISLVHARHELSYAFRQGWP